MIEGVLLSAIFAFAAVFAADSSADPPAAWVQAYAAANQKHRAGDYAGAEAALAPVIATVLQSDSDHRLRAKILAEYASIQQDLGRPLGAETFYRRSLTVWARLSPTTPERVETLHNLATLYVETGQDAKAGQLVKEFEHVDSTMQPLLRSRILIMLGSLARRRHDFEAAEGFYVQSIALSRDAAAATTELPSALSGLGALHLQAGRLELAAQYLQQALTALEGVFSPDHPVVIAPLVNVALIKRRCGDPEAAEPFARRAVELSERTLGPAHSLTAEALLELSRILRQLHRKGDAKALEARARSILSNSMRSDPSALYTIDAGRLAAGGR